MARRETSIVIFANVFTLVGFVSGCGRSQTAAEFDMGSAYDLAEAIGQQFPKSPSESTSMATTSYALEEGEKAAETKPAETKPAETTAAATTAPDPAKFASWNQNGAGTWQKYDNGNWLTASSNPDTTDGAIVANWGANKGETGWTPQSLSYAGKKDNNAYVFSTKDQGLASQWDQQKGVWKDPKQTGTTFIDNLKKNPSSASQKFANGKYYSPRKSGDKEYWVEVNPYTQEPVADAKLLAKNDKGALVATDEKVAVTNLTASVPPNFMQVIGGLFNQAQTTGQKQGGQKQGQKQAGGQQQTSGQQQGGGNGGTCNAQGGGCGGGNGGGILGGLFQ